MVEGILPNVQQVAPLTEHGDRVHPFSGPMMTRWLVPIDDANTLFIELRHLSESEDNPPWWVDRNQMMPGQIAMESYEDSQRHPGDFEAQVSQRPIAIHGLEHLSETDRGVSMFRNQVRRGIRAVRAGKAPAGLVRDEGVVTATYCNNTVVHLPAPPDGAADKKIMREAGMRLAKDYLAHPPLLNGG
jgi:hypothetical protein